MEYSQDFKKDDNSTGMYKHLQEEFFCSKRNTGVEDHRKRFKDKILDDLEDTLQKKKEYLKWLLLNQSESKEAHVHLRQIRKTGFEIEKVNNGTNLM